MNHPTSLLVIALSSTAACAVKLAGASPAEAPAKAAAAHCRAPASMAPDDQLPIPSTPADPWAGVDGTRPAAVALDNPSARRANMLTRQIGTCDAHHDHCLPECTWMVEPGNVRGRTRWVTPVLMRPDGKFVAPGADGAGIDDPEPGFIAYRTVPATRRLLRAGVKVAIAPGQFTDSAPVRVPENEGLAMSLWKLGTLGDVDWDAGTFTIAGSPTHFYLSAARVVVLVYRDGGAVELADGLARKEIAVTASDVIMPGTDE